MSSALKVGNFLLSPAASGLAGLYLAVQSLLNEKDRSGIGIAIAAGFIIFNSLLGYLRARSLRVRLAPLKARIYDRLFDLIGSLGELSGDRYECWKVELYLAHWQPAVSKTFPYVMAKVLVRDASADIAATVNLRDTVDLLEEGPIGVSYRDIRPVAWLHPNSQITSDLDMFGINERCDVQLVDECGAMRLAPVVSRLNADCIGVLCVHTEPSFAPILAGTAFTDQFARRVLDAAYDLHRIVMDTHD